MSFLVWDSSMETGISILDDRHQQIITTYNTLQTAFHSTDRARIESSLMQLIERFESNFLYEESLLEQSGYNLCDAHIALHQAFILKLEKHLQRFRANEDISRKFDSDITIWAYNHIRHEDKKYLAYVKPLLNSGIKGWFSRQAQRVL
ncbi:MAG: bacteriohemerythrin [Candidatus Sedimenticola sp. PURPLELP]